MKERLTDLSIQNSSGFPIKKEIVSFFASKVNTQSVFKKHFTLNTLKKQIEKSKYTLLCEHQTFFVKLFKVCVVSCFLGFQRKKSFCLIWDLISLLELLLGQNYLVTDRVHTTRNRIHHSFPQNLAVPSLACSMLNNHQMFHKFGQKMTKSLFNLLQNSFLYMYFHNFLVLDPPLVTYIQEIHKITQTVDVDKQQIGILPQSGKFLRSHAHFQAFFKSLGMEEK